MQAEWAESPWARGEQRELSHECSQHQSCPVELISGPVYVNLVLFKTKFVGLFQWPCWPEGVTKWWKHQWRLIHNLWIQTGGEGGGKEKDLTWTEEIWGEDPEPERWSFNLTKLYPFLYAFLQWQTRTFVSSEGWPCLSQGEPSWFSPAAHHPLHVPHETGRPSNRTSSVFLLKKRTVVWPVCSRVWVALRSCICAREGGSSHFFICPVLPPSLPNHHHWRVGFDGRYAQNEKGGTKL